MFKVPEKFRKKQGILSSTEEDGNNGIFIIPINHGTIYACCIASDGEGYEHVSVTLATKERNINRCPTWEEMCALKDIFWSEDDCVIQYHPPKSDHVNNHKYCLHLWRPVDAEIPRPHHSLVGLKLKR